MVNSSLNLTLRTLTDASKEEETLLGGLMPTYSTGSLVNMEEDVRNGPYSFFLSNLESSAEDGAVLGEFSQWGYQTPQAQREFNNQSVKTTTVLQVCRRHSKVIGFKPPSIPSYQIRRCLREI